jgi:uncharacterized protein (DUF488 family)
MKMELFTIGYEGASTESLFHSLRINKIQILCDVRKNPVSRKPGFSKKALMAVCEANKISYLHFPQLGIDSDRRKNLHSEEDFERLFKYYQEKVVPAGHKEMAEILECIRDSKRIALMCFEKDPANCHRSRLAETLLAMGNGQFSVKNIRIS